MFGNSPPDDAAVEAYLLYGRNAARIEKYAETHPAFAKQLQRLREEVQLLEDLKGARGDAPAGEVLERLRGICGSVRTEEAKGEES